MMVEWTQKGVGREANAPEGFELLKNLACVDQ